MLTLSLRSFIAQVDQLDLASERYPYCYSERSMVKLFLYSLVKGIPHSGHRSAASRACAAILLSVLKCSNW